MPAATINTITANEMEQEVSALHRLCSSLTGCRYDEVEVESRHLINGINRLKGLQCRSARVMARYADAMDRAFSTLSNRRSEFNDE